MRIRPVQGWPCTLSSLGLGLPPAGNQKDPSPCSSHHPTPLLFDLPLQAPPTHSRAHPGLLPSVHSTQGTCPLLPNTIHTRGQE